MIALIGKFLARCIQRSEAFYYASIVALASVAQTLLEACKSTLVVDVADIKANFKKRLEADTDKKLAEAAHAANSATTAAYEQARRNHDLERLAIENRKHAAEAAKAGAEALRATLEVIEEARKMRLDAAQAELLDALIQYQREGGQLYIDSKNLEALLKLKDSPADSPPQDS